jgi:hypothetical protein
MLPAMVIYVLRRTTTGYELTVSDESNDYRGYLAQPR